MLFWQEKWDSSLNLNISFQCCPRFGTKPAGNSCPKRKFLKTPLFRGNHFPVCSKAVGWAAETVVIAGLKDHICEKWNSSWGAAPGRAKSTFARFEEKMKNRELEPEKPYYRLSDYLVLALLAATGIAFKSVIVPLVQIITAPLFVPGGVLAGGFYMMFLILGTSLTGKRGAAFLVSFIQAVLVTTVGPVGFHGAASLFTYTISGLGVELWFYLSGHRGCCSFCCFVAGVVANLTGSLAVNFVIFRLPWIPLLLALATAALSGGLGGLLAHSIGRKMRKAKIL